MFVRRQLQDSQTNSYGLVARQGSNRLPKNVPPPRHQTLSTVMPLIWRHVAFVHQTVAFDAELKVVLDRLLDVVGARLNRRQLLDECAVASTLTLRA